MSSIGTTATSLSNVLSTVQRVAESLTVAANAADTLARSEPVKLLVRARTLSAVKAALPWVVVPLAAGGLAYWGVRAWRRKRAEYPHVAAGNNHASQPAHPA